MIARIVVANQSQARFFDSSGPASALQAVGRLDSPDARLHDRDLKSDRPGRVFTSASGGGGRRRAVAHHGTGGEHSPREHVATVFARRVADELATAKQQRKFDRLVLIVAPAFLGELRKALPQSLHSVVAAEVAKDLQDASDDVVREHIPAQAYQAAR